VVPELPLPGVALSGIEADPDGYVLSVAAEAKRHEWPAFNPKPEVIE